MDLLCKDAEARLDTLISLVDFSLEERLENLQKEGGIRKVIEGTTYDSRGKESREGQNTKRASTGWGKERERDRVR